MLGKGEVSIVGDVVTLCTNGTAMITNSRSDIIDSPLTMGNDGQEEN